MSGCEKSKWSLSPVSVAIICIIFWGATVIMSSCTADVDGDAFITAAGLPAEAGLEPFLGEPRFDLNRVLDVEQRFPNVVVTTKGTVLVTICRNSYKIRRSEDGGDSWEPIVTLAEPVGYHGGGVTVDELSGDVLAFVLESRERRQYPDLYRSRDDGKTWEKQAVVIHPDANGNLPLMHMNGRGITLRRGGHAGRLLRPDSASPGEGGYRYVNALYSDDGGMTWHSSAPFPAEGTLEGVVEELSDGRIFYVTRRNHGPKPGEEGVLVRPDEIPVEDIRPEHIMRHSAWSYDAGETWVDLSISHFLYDGGGMRRGQGSLAGLARLPVRNRDILLFSQPDTEIGRHSMTVWASFDGGLTWPVKRLVSEEPTAYSSMAAGRPGTPSEGWIYLLYEGSEYHRYDGANLARFNLSWVIEGERTGDGVIPMEFLARK